MSPAQMIHDAEEVVEGSANFPRRKTRVRVRRTGRAVATVEKVANLDGTWDEAEVHPVGRGVMSAAEADDYARCLAYAAFCAQRYDNTYETGTPVASEESQS